MANPFSKNIILPLIECDEPLDGSDARDKRRSHREADPRIGDHNHGEQRQCGLT